DRCRATHVSIEAAQPRLDCAILATLPSKTIIFGVLDLGDERVETPEVVAGRIRAALAHVPPERLLPAPRPGLEDPPPQPGAVAMLAAVAAGAPLVGAALGR